MHPIRPVAAILMLPTAALAQEPPSQAKAPPEKPEEAISWEPRVHLRAGAWFTELDGTLSVGDAIPGAVSDIDLIDTLDLDPDEFAFLGSVVIDLGAAQRWHVGAGYSGQFKYDGTSDPINIAFDNLNFTGVVESDAKLSVYEIGVSYDFWTPPPVTVALGLSTRILDFEGSITGTATDPNTNVTRIHTSSADAIAPLPGLSATLRWDLTNQIYVRGSAQGLYLGNYGDYFDAAAEVGFDFTANVGLFGGYRWMHAHADVSDVDFEVNLRGFYTGVEVRF